ncbi:MAG TPA: glycosyltransferase family 39 protein [Acidimicrobiales bacterium]|nr:glycosyltransferase family 39 protein [Acidimicrobiales bacterium]
MTASPATATRGGAGNRAAAAAVIAGVALTLAFVWTMLVGDYAQYAAFLIAAALIAVTVPIARHAARVEAWPGLFGWLMAGMVLRLGGAIARYLIAYGAYGGVADATTYTDVANSHYHAFRHLHVFTPNTSVFHGLIPWLDTVVYALFGPTEIGSFFLFSWFNFLGTYLFYRAFRIAYPAGDGRRYAALLLLLPGLVYWPSSLGKEGWMMLAIGLTCYGLARALASRPGGYLSIAGGIGGIVLVRPHLALILLPAAMLAFLVRRSQPGRHRPLGRLIGLAVLIVASLVAVSKVESYFGIKSLDVQTVTQELQTTREQTQLGGSAFHPPNPQSPVGYPEAVVTVLFRPFPFEAHSLTVLVASFEGVLLMGLTAVSWRRLKRLPRALWDSPYILFCFVYTALFILAFGNFANYGILARERVQLWPMYLAMLAIPLAPVDAQVATAGVSVGRRRRGRRARPERRLPSYPRPVPVARRASSTAGTYRALGYTFSVGVDRRLAPEAARAVRWAFANLAEPAVAEGRYRLAPSGTGVAVHADGRRLGQGASLSDAVELLLADVNRRAVQSRPDRLGVHAAALAFAGRGILVVGPSGAGKSTLAGALVAAGCDYLTDEAAFVDLDDLTVEPYPKPLSLEPGSLALLDQAAPDLLPSGGCEIAPASHFRRYTVIGAARVAAIVVLDGSPDPQVKLAPMSRAEALIEVANNSFNFVEHGSEWLEGLRSLVTASSCWRLGRGEVRIAARAVIEAVEAELTPKETVCQT